MHNACTVSRSGSNNQGHISVISCSCRAFAGGTASDNSAYLPDGPYGVGPNGIVSINNKYFDEINLFQAQTGAKIIWDLCRQTNSKGAYDPTINATALFEYTQAQGYDIFGWEVGNELTNVSPQQYGADVALLRSTLKDYNVGQVC